MKREFSSAIFTADNLNAVPAMCCDRKNMKEETAAVMSFRMSFLYL